MTETRTDAQLLRAAAEQLRRLAVVATPGPWLVEYTYGGTAPQAIFRMDPQYPGDPDQAISLGVMEDNPADNAWVATVHPGVAGPLAKWLDESGDDLERHLPRWTGATGGIPGEYPPIHRTPEDTARIVEGHYGRALAVARELLGEEVRSDG